MSTNRGVSTGIGSYLTNKSLKINKLLEPLLADTLPYLLNWLER